MIKKETYNQDIKDLMKSVFEEQVDYTPEGHETFCRVLDDKEYMQNYTFYTKRDEKLLGVIGIIDDVIEFFFVESHHERQGIGRELFNYLLTQTDDHLIVHASPNAYGFYHALGFEDRDEEVTIDGLTTKEMMYLRRCSYVPVNDSIYIAYHDHEWGVPSHDEHYLYEMLILECFQAGLSWRTILAKRENFRKAYDNFDPLKVATYDEKKIATLMQDQGIIRHKLKIVGSIVNTQIFLAIEKEWGSFDQYIWSFTDGQVIYEYDQTRSPLSDQVSKDLKKRGMKFVGSVTIYSYLQAIGVINSHEPGCFKYKK
jgi:DNA-3-methyladenine glycosylase I